MKAPADDALALARAAYAEGRDSDLVALTERAIVEGGVVDGELFFLRASALRRLGRPDEALVAFEASDGLGYRAPEAAMERALALSAAGRTQEAEQEMHELRRLFQEDPDKLAPFEERWRRRDQKVNRFEARLRPQIGYDTNIVAAADDALVAEDVDRRSVTYGILLSARYRLLEDDDRVLGIEYQNAARAYASESELAYTDNTLALAGRIPLRPSIDFQGRASISEAFMSDDGHFRTLRSLAPAFNFRPLVGLEIRLWSEWGDAGYYFDAPNEQDRDGSFQQIGLGLRIELGRGWSLGSSVSLLDYDAQGADYDRRERQPALSVTAPEAAGVIAALTAAYVLADFDNPNSLSGFTEAREDRRIALTLTLTFRALEDGLGFAPSLSVRFEDWDSNIAAYDFSRWQPSIDLAFLAYSF
jgi:hypothetical protein